MKLVIRIVAGLLILGGLALGIGSTLSVGWLAAFGMDARVAPLGFVLVAVGIVLLALSLRRRDPPPPPPQWGRG